MKITEEMIQAAQAVAPGVDQSVIIAILQAGLLEGSLAPINALCQGVASIVLHVSTPKNAAYDVLHKAIEDLNK